MTTTIKMADFKGFIHKEDQMKFSKVFASIKMIILFAFFSTSSFAQNTEDTTDRRFHDDLLDHLVGNWHDTATAHGHMFTTEVDVSWVLNHQYLLIHLKSNEVIPWWHVQMEYYEYIGYNHYQQRYTVHEMTIEGDEDPSEGFSYGFRNGNEFKTVSKIGVDSLIVQRFTWAPASGTWTIKSNWVIAGKEGDVFLDMKLVAVKPSTK